jgi:hypothetical protein
MYSSDKQDSNKIWYGWFQVVIIFDSVNLRIIFVSNLSDNKYQSQISKYSCHSYRRSKVRDRHHYYERCQRWKDEVQELYVELDGRLNSQPQEWKCSLGITIE